MLGQADVVAIADALEHPDIAVQAKVYLAEIAVLKPDAIHALLRTPNPSTRMSSPVAFSLFDGQPEWSEMALVVAVTFLLASIVSSFTARLVRVLLTKIYGKAAEGAPALVSRPVLVTRLVTFLLVFAVTTIPTLDGIGEHFDVGLDSQTAFRWALASGFRIIIIVTLAWLVIRMDRSNILEWPGCSPTS